MSRTSITIIGAGNVAWHLAPALENAGMVVRQVFARNQEKATALTRRLYQAEVAPSLDFSNSKTTFFLLAVSDAAIEEIAREIILPEDAVIAHTSATVPMEELNYAGTPHMGVLYPLQTFSKQRKLDMSTIPFFIESSDVYTKNVLSEVASALSSHVIVSELDQRRALHLAAVFANNFTNHMVKIAEDIVRSNDNDLSVLLPLLKETFAKLLAIGPEAAQTGPARRGDWVTIDRHLEHLNQNDSLHAIYSLLSGHIAETYSEDKD